jgi:hypothetical protein
VDRFVGPELDTHPALTCSPDERLNEAEVGRRLGKTDETKSKQA